MPTMRQKVKKRSIVRLGVRRARLPGTPEALGPWFTRDKGERCQGSKGSDRLDPINHRQRNIDPSLAERLHTSEAPLR